MKLWLWRIRQLSWIHIDIHIMPTGADFNRALELKPDDPGGYNTRGSFYRERKQYDLALADFSKALQLNADSGFVYTDRGELYMERKQYDLALADFNKAVELDPRGRS